MSYFPTEQRLPHSRSSHDGAELAAETDGRPTENDGMWKQEVDDPRDEHGAASDHSSLPEIIVRECGDPRDWRLNAKIEEPMGLITQITVLEARPFPT
jgi:hypothetical protein